MIGRRGFISALALLAVFSPGMIRAAVAAPLRERSLSLLNIHTGENLNTVYQAEGAYDDRALKDIHRVLRCHYSDEIAPIATTVLDLLCDIKDALDWKGRIAIISGYRSPRYNELLVAAGKKVSRDSLHMQGRAIDFSLEGVSTRTLSGIARSFVIGGVGRYPGFVHIDDGRVRYW
ncbi:MAG: DUF882 domain-containing protein [Nitrospiraceae bacterium]|nr:DUF882 domain-containing protein [Nitrospiraceae bacterium]